MQFGLFFEQSVARPVNRANENRAMHNCVEQVVLAEELGFDQAWIVEHHFLESYSHCSAPEVFLSFCAARTSKIRLGHGVRIILPEVNHPIRAASSAAYLDQISNGRLEFGTGRQTTWAEMGGFGVQPDRTKEQWDDIVRQIPRMWMEEDFSCDTKYLKVPPRPIYPKPLQVPHPPMWVAVQSPDTAMIAAERGLGFLGVSSTSDPSKYKTFIDDYRKGVKTCTPVGAYVNEQVNVFSWMHCATSEEDIERARVTANSFYQTAQHVVGVGSIHPGPAYLPGANAAGGALRSPERPDRPIGNPDHCIQALKQWEDIGVDRMLFVTYFGDMIPHEDVLASLRLFAKEVMPAFVNKPSVSPPVPVQSGIANEGVHP